MVISKIARPTNSRSKSFLKRNKAIYAATQVACGWAGAVIVKGNYAFRQEQQKLSINTEKVKKVKFDGRVDGRTGRWTDGQTGGWTDRQTDGRTDNASCRVSCR